MIQDQPLAETVRVYVWEWPVRVCHWFIAGSIAVLAVTGLYIANPGPITTGLASQRSLMGLAKLIHYSTAIVFGIAVISRIWWMFAGNNYARWDKFVPARKKRWKALGPTLGYYLFRFRKPPGLSATTRWRASPTRSCSWSTCHARHRARDVLGERPRRLAAPVVHLPGAVVRRRLDGALAPPRVHVDADRICRSPRLQRGPDVTGRGQRDGGFDLLGYKFVPREDLVYSGYRFIDRKDTRG